ncbi:Cobalt-zinc-cadmium resistance protein CzcC precursor [Novipirellula galeiformis]|uniref:Cobalt-zinc-cadmium resistance protein CzcC n=1 Tax=Novipirellula galeiformis TaxID=2528004 RepID=A0A5C6C0A1_9BACT|nr:TolC family protein [Novipirellula galeiformis]TWU17532.1 Cobalt-zinc-cadmium resistance protein CzcC precursor [Novipirellula galeiformis]
MSKRRIYFAHLLLAASTTGFIGCASTAPFSSIAPFSSQADSDQGTLLDASLLDDSIPEASEPASDVAVAQVVFDQRSQDNHDDASTNATVQVAIPFAEATYDASPMTFTSNPLESGPLESGQSVMTLADFEALALAGNPTIQELVATTQKAAGFRTQVGLWANPTLGYQGVQLADQGTDQHTVSVSQTIVTADKLKLNRRVVNEAVRSQLLELEAQKYRVATDIRVKFFDALAAQQRVKLISDFQSVVEKGLELAELRKQALEGSQLDVVQAKVQKNEIDLALQQAEISLATAWRELAALAGTPHLAPVTLQGELPDADAAMDWPTVASTMVVSSPEYQAAQTRVSQARANLDRQCVQPIPNLDLQFATGRDNATGSGLINVQVGAPIPVFNKNQGNIAAARAEWVRASKELERIENSIKARLAAVSREYDSSRVAVAKYSEDILPNAADGLTLAETAYKAGETSFVQVLVARRSYFDTNLQYVASQAQLAQARARVDGYVLTGALEAVLDNSGDDGLRGLTFSQQ